MGRNMQSKYIPAVVTLVAGLITSVICLLQKKDQLESLQILLAVLLVFYIIGVIAKVLIVRTLREDKASVDHSAEEKTETEDESEKKNDDKTES